MKSVFQRIALFTIAICVTTAVAEKSEKFDSNIPPEPVAWTYFTYEGLSSFDDKPLVPEDPTAPAIPVDADETQVEIYEYALAVTPFITQIDHWMLGIGTEFKWTRFNFKGKSYNTEDLYTIHIPFLNIFCPFIVGQ